ncbi:dihydrofolate reductase family protein [Solirubrobacter sp. CPCC 204708]|uniref:Dihydrofolate reductase family protein n=1 Tax=Solirubrobacter deserti TaxID=2282478 RepID=A0ABT4RKX5_9ACTN|nr:dihydrofolate reductase family protein [Solirubrobacter deserti]MBE2319135.1 dihydrofolate reductase family protein [Solirubrobacter deserti]MDA0139211.1 dihydrofolate reductase family protein [Solirubrobacter deserti]
MFQRLDAAGAPREASSWLAAADLGSLARSERPHVFFNFVGTLDGRAALDGSTKPLGGPADLEMLLSLRAAADAVLIGPGTVRAEGYGRLVGPKRRPTSPPAVLLSRRFDIPWEAGLFAAADQPVIVYGPADAGEPPAGIAAPVEVVRLDECTPARALADLRARGVRALLSEGGPTLFRSLLVDQLVDELFLTLTPVITGDEAELSIVSGGRLPDLARFSLRWILRSEDELFLRYAFAR